MRHGSDEELAVLCRSCGLCCDGSLFGRVGLAPAERPAARRHRLRVIPSGSAFEQPCAALPVEGDDRGCSIYADRPLACRAFTCRLYDRHRREGGPLDARLAAVSRARVLLHVVETASDGAGRDAALAELIQRMEDDFARALPRGESG